jgi:hypothetical protein
MSGKKEDKNKTHFEDRMNPSTKKGGKHGEITDEGAKKLSEAIKKNVGGPLYEPPKDKS